MWGPKCPPKLIRSVSLSRRKVAPLGSCRIPTRDLAVIEVLAAALDGVSEDDAGRLAIELLRLNHEARFEHPWSIVLDDYDIVTLLDHLVGAHQQDLRDCEAEHLRGSQTDGQLELLGCSISDR
jgi:hypothetical protein